MREKKLVIQNKTGLHARPAALFVQLANKFDSRIRVAKNEQEVNGKSIMEILMLAVAKGTEIRIMADGKDEEKALASLEGLINRKFGEEE
jgi:phosphocarrier protein